MTKDEFVLLQLQYHQSGKSLKAFLKDSGICYSNYHYWNKKYKSADTPQELAPITFMKTMTRESASAASANDMPSGTSLLFPNGLRAHFGPGANDILVEILMKSLSGHVLP
jgi:putative transposase